MPPRSKILQWSYSGKPLSNTKDEVRFLVGDTNPDDKQLDDCEIEYLLDREGSVIDAAICAVYGLIALYSRDFDGQFGSSTSSQIATAYRELLKDLRDKRARKPLVMLAGGLTKSDKLTQEMDTNRVRPVFTKTFGENPRALQPQEAPYRDGYT